MYPQKFVVLARTLKGDVGRIKKSHKSRVRTCEYVMLTVYYDNKCAFIAVNICFWQPVYFLSSFVQIIIHVVMNLDVPQRKM